MSSHPEDLAPSFAELRSQLVRHVQALVARPATELSQAHDQLLNALAMLNGPPLMTDEFGHAADRLKNAHRFLVSDERGAARLELRMLLHSLKSHIPERN